VVEAVAEVAAHVVRPAIQVPIGILVRKLKASQPTYFP
jgi:hypothetical protein